MRDDGHEFSYQTDEERTARMDVVWALCDAYEKPFDPFISSVLVAVTAGDLEGICEIYLPKARGYRFTKIVELLEGFVEKRATKPEHFRVTQGGKKRRSN